MDITSNQVIIKSAKHLTIFYIILGSVWCCLAIMHNPMAASGVAGSGKVSSLRPMVLRCLKDSNIIVKGNNQIYTSMLVVSRLSCHWIS